MKQNNTQPIVWRIDLFGGLRAYAEGRTIERFPTQKTGALLAFLAFHRLQRCSRETAADMLWPDADLAAARDRLSQALVWLRPRLEPEGVVRGEVLVADRLSIGLNPAALTTDVGEFEAALGAARLADTPAARMEALGRAVDLHRGELLPGYYGDWILIERRRLLEAYLLALRQLVEFYEQEGDAERALGYARRAVAADPLQEEAQTDLIRLLSATGQTAAALRQFQYLTDLLQKELGVEPSAETVALIEQVRRNQTAASRLKPLSARPPALLTPLTRFFGREVEIEQICRMVQSEGARLVTLTGIGGSGKTRLGMAVAAKLVEAYRGAVAFVPLADLTEAQTIPAAVAVALRLPPSAVNSSLEPLIEALSTRPFLLILDNVEHLLTGALPLVRELLEQIPTLTVLTTSRQRLGLEGEREAPVPPLPLPAPEATLEQILASSSTQLFVDRAQSVRPDFAVTSANAKAVANVCTRLDGIPLAIELCAAWTQVLSPSQMLEKLGRRFDLLVSRRADITPRHRTLRAALEYSYLQLPKDCQRLFTRLSVFRGGWSLEAAESVCCEAGEQDPFSLLAGLTEMRERSLIVAEEIETGEAEGEMRYRMLETLREFAWEQASCADRTACRRLHAIYFLKRAEQAEAAPAGQEQERLPAQLAREQENLRTALNWCLEAGEPEIGLRLGGALGRYWSMRGPLSEGYNWLRKLLDMADAAPPEVPPPPVKVTAKAWKTLGHLAWSQGDYRTAYAAHEQGLTLRRAIGDAAGVAESLYHLGITAYRLDDYTSAQGFFDESLMLARARDDQGGVARVLLNLGNIAYEQHRNEEAAAFFQQSLLLEQQLGNRRREADALNNLGLIAIADKNYSGAADLFQRGLDIYRELTDDYGVAIVLANLGAAERLQGRKERSRAQLTMGLKLAYDLGNKHIMVHYLLQMGLLEAEEQNFARSVLLLSGSRRLIEATGSSKQIDEADGCSDAMATARIALGEVAYNALWLRGRTISLGQVVSLALSVSSELDAYND